MYDDLWSQYIKVQKLFKGENYSRAETIPGNTVCPFLDKILIYYDPSSKKFHNPTDTITDMILKQEFADFYCKINFCLLFTIHYLVNKLLIVVE